MSFLLLKYLILTHIFIFHIFSSSLINSSLKLYSSHSYLFVQLIHLISHVQFSDSFIWKLFHLLLLLPLRPICFIIQKTFSHSHLYLLLLSSLHFEFQLSYSVFRYLHSFPFFFFLHFSRLQFHSSFHSSIKLPSRRILIKYPLSQ